MTLKTAKKVNITFHGTSAPYEAAAKGYLKQAFGLLKIKRAMQGPFNYVGYVIVNIEGTVDDILNAMRIIYNIDIELEDGIPVSVCKNFTTPGCVNNYSAI